MITAIIRNKENTLVLELPHSIYDIYEKLQSIGIMQPPKRIPLTDNEDEDIGVKLFSESDFGQHLLLTLNARNTIADANMLTLVIGAASEDIKEELEQNILYDQYDSMDEVISAVRQMTQDAGPVKAVFFCPLVGNIDEGDGDMFTVGDSYLADSTDEISDALKKYTANDENDMATYPPIVDAEELVGSSCHVNQIRLSLGSFLIHETVHRVILGHGFQQAVHDQEECFAQFWRPTFGSPCALCLIGSRLVSTRINPCKSSNRVSVGEPGHIPNFRHELRAEGISHTAHSHDNWIFGKLGGQSERFSL